MLSRLRSQPSASDGLSLLDLRAPSRSGLADRFVFLADQLAAQDDLSPRPKVNALFTALVGSTATTDTAKTHALLDDPRIQSRLPELRRTCAKGEALLEKHWAAHVLGASNPKAALEDFPYIDNYRKLVHMEVKSMEIAGALPERLLFIGSGPLPLTSHLMSEEYGIRVDNLDIDPVAAQEGERVSEALGNDRMRFMVGDIFSLTPEQIGSYDAVYVAALAGLTRNAKREVFGQLTAHAKPGSLAVARSASRLRTLLYPEVHPEDAVGYAPAVLVHPLDDVVNSALVLRKEA